MKLIPEKYKTKGGSRTELFLSGFSNLGNYLLSKAKLLMVLSLILLLGVVLSYFGLLGYKNSLMDEREVVENDVSVLQGQRNLETEAVLAELKEKIDMLKSLLKIHIYPSRVFQMLEELALPQVRFVDLQADFSKMQLGLNAEMADYSVLAKQISVFEEDSKINTVNVSDINLNEFGRVEADFLLRIDSSFLR